MSAVACCAAMLSGCRDEAPYVFGPMDQSEFADWGEIFDSYWNGMNYGYVFWDVDPTDWDKVYADYRPQFDRLKFGSPADSAKAVDLFRELTSTLIDHHYALELKDARGQVFATINPSEDLIIKREDFHPMLSPRQLYANITAMERAGRVSSLTGRADFTFGGLSFYTCLIDNSIVYLRLSAFSLHNYIDDERVDKAMNNYYDLINGTPGLKGIIIDTRSNLGGATGNLHSILTPLLRQPLTIGYARTKMGQGRLDYAPWTPMTLEPREDMEQQWVTRDVTGLPVVSLIDICSVSMGEMTAVAVQEMPGGTVIGERSWGAQGTIINDHSVFYAGDMSNRAFNLHMSVMMTKRLDGKCYESIGVIPDIEVRHNQDEFKRGNDVQLNRAIEFIASGK